MNLTDGVHEFVDSVLNALNGSISDYKKLFSEEEWVYESPVVIKTPSERRTKAVKDFLDGMVYIPSSDAELRDYRMKDYANYFDDIPAPTCLHDFCMHKGINSDIQYKLGFGVFAFDKISQALSFVEKLSSMTGYKFEIAQEEEIIWAKRIGRDYSRFIHGGPKGSPILAVGKDGNYEMIIYDDKYGENISRLKTDDWNKAYDFYVVCKSDELIDKQLSILEDKINEDIEDEEDMVSLKRS